MKCWLGKQYCLLQTHLLHRCGQSLLLCIYIVFTVVLVQSQAHWGTFTIQKRTRVAQRNCVTRTHCVTNVTVSNFPVPNLVPNWEHLVITVFSATMEYARFLLSNTLTTKFEWWDPQINLGSFKRTLCRRFYSCSHNVNWIFSCFPFWYLIKNGTRICGIEDFHVLCRGIYTKLTHK